MNKNLKEVVKLTVLETIRFYSLSKLTKELYSYKEASEILNLSYYKLKKLVKQGKLKTTPDGKKITKNSIIDFLES